MSSLESGAEKDRSMPLSKERELEGAQETSVDQDAPNLFTRTLRNQSSVLLTDIFAGITPIIKETVIFAAFMVADYCVVSLAGLLFSHIINKYTFLQYIYDGIEFASFTVITFHFLGNCILEMNKDKKNIVKELLPEKDQEKVQ